MKRAEVQAGAAWVYTGVWAVLTRLLRVPAQPPSIPVQGGGLLEQLRPADGFLRLLKFQFWLTMLLIDAPLLIGWAAITVALPIVGAILLLPALLVIVGPAVVGYTAIHLRYDTTWYVLTDRSVRIRRGIWIIMETTITYENIQNVVVTQGPVQRWFGIADVVIQTAGGGGAHAGLLEGLANAQRIRDLFLARLAASRSAGLGDEHAEAG